MEHLIIPKFCLVSCFEETSIGWPDWEWMKLSKWVTKKQVYWINNVNGQQYLKFANFSYY